MRDPKRIKPFLEKVEKFWTENPDLRFGQLLMVIAKTSEQHSQLFYMEEDEFIKKMEALEIPLKSNKSNT